MALQNCRCRQPHCHLTPPPRGTPANIRNFRIHLIFPETSHWSTILPLIVWIIHSNLCSGLQKDASFLQKSAYQPSRSSNVDNFGTNRKRLCDFLLVINSNYGPILHRFWDTTYWLKLPIFPTPLSFGVLAPYVPFEISRWSLYSCSVMTNILNM